jgi:hypothetical protein
MMRLLLSRAQRNTERLRSVALLTRDRSKHPSLERSRLISAFTRVFNALVAGTRVAPSRSAADHYDPARNAALSALRLSAAYRAG